MQQKFTKIRRKLLTFGSIFVFVFASFSPFGSVALAQPVFNDEVNIVQETLLSGGYTLRHLLESGGHFFSTPFTPEDGHGEGETGLRAAQRAALYPNPTQSPSWFLRLNGLDSQSCFECHNTIGSYNEPGTANSQAMLRKPGVTSGSAGFASDAFINPSYPGTERLLIRNPPHVFGTGYTQELANEMTEELQEQGEFACMMAKDLAAKNFYEQDLSAKGLEFGTVRVTYNEVEDKCTNEIIGAQKVSKDLVVRPFQWKGIASSTRTFARDALDFHFSLQAEEKFGHHDCDNDGMINEVTVGNVTALNSFVAMTRPPMQIIPAGQEEIVARGQRLFEEGPEETVPLGQRLFEDDNSCASCHASGLSILRNTVTIPPPAMDPDTIPASDCPQDLGRIGLGNAGLTTEQLPVIRQFRKNFIPMKERLKNLFIQGAVTSQISETDPQPGPQDDGSYVISLSPTPADDLPAYVYPRLNENPDGSINVRLYSDLRTHNMGEGLSDVTFQETDVTGINIPAELFLTRPLWGVGDTAPYLHDGRARTLREAILMHDSNGSEAHHVIEAFTGMPTGDQDAIIAFLQTLRLPIQQGLEITNSLASN